MGKGGYHGGSTIIILKPTERDLNSVPDPFENKRFKCKICGKIFYGIYYSEHLREEHDCNGCGSCGEPYKPSPDQSKHVCENCGKSIILSTRNKNNKSILISTRNKKAKKNEPTKTLHQKTGKGIRKNESKTMTRKNVVDKESFGLKLGDLLQAAFDNKTIA